MKTFFHRFGVHCAMEEMEDMIQNVDENSDGQISFEEFSHLLLPQRHNSVDGRSYVSFFIF